MVINKQNIGETKTNSGIKGEISNNPALNFSNQAVESTQSRNLSKVSPSAAAGELRTVRENLTAQNLEPAIQTLKGLVQAYKTNEVPNALLNGSVGIEVRALAKILPSAINSMEQWLASLSPLGMTDDPNWHFDEGARLGDLREMQKSVDELSRAIDAKQKNNSAISRC